MLKRVVFILEKSNWQDEARGLLDELAARGVEACAGNIDSILDDNITADDNAAVNDSNIEMESPDKDKDISQMRMQDYADAEGVLYVTDNAACQKYLQGRRLPVLVYLHEGNRNEKFSRAEYAIEQIGEVEYESLELAYLRLTGQPWTILTTDRCIIRETTVEDADSFYEIYKDPSITRYMEDLYADKTEEAAYIQDYIRNVYAFYGYGMWTVLEKKSGEAIGRAGISWREGFDVPELGFVIAAPYQRQGYAYEVCMAILEYGKKELGFGCVQALVMEGNESSKALCGRLGFKAWDKPIVDGVEYERFMWEKR